MSEAMKYELPPLPKNLLNVVRRIRICEGNVAAQVVFEHALNNYAIAAIEQGVPDGWQLVRTDALKMAIDFAVPAMERDRDSPSNSAWMVEAAERNINAVRAMLASAPPAPQAEKAQSLPSAVKTVIAAMKEDPDYAWSWHCNVAMAFVDAGGDAYTANQGAARFMRSLSGVEPAYELPAPQASVVQQEPANVRWRWNIELDGDDLLVCFNDHDKGESCSYQRYVPAPQAKPIGWLYDWTHSSALGKPDEHFTSFTTDEEHARKNSNARPVFDAAQQAKPQPLSDEQIIRDGLLTTPIAVLHNIGDTFKAGARFAEAAHGITKE